MPMKPGRRKRLTNPDDDNQYVELGLVDDIFLKHGSGQTYRVEHIALQNDSPNTSRKVHTKTITHLGQDVDGNPEGSDDPNQKIDMEVIDQFSIQHGSGGIFQRRHYKLDQSDEGRASRKPHTHTKRVHARDDDGNDIDDTWLDVRRTDEFAFQTGSGPTFQRHILQLNWQDADFETATPNAPLDTDPDDDFDPPWRLDPFQEVVNVRWRQVGLELNWQWTGIVTLHSSEGLGASCESPTSYPAGSVNFGGAGTASIDFSSMAGPFGAEGATISGVPSISGDTQSFGPYEASIVGLAHVRTTGATPSGTTSLLGILNQSLPACVGVDVPEDGRGNFFAVYDNHFSSIGGSISVDATGITATFDGSTWHIDHVLFESSAGLDGQGGIISLTAFMKRDPPP